MDSTGGGQSHSDSTVSDARDDRTIGSKSITRKRAAGDVSAVVLGLALLFVLLLVRSRSSPEPRPDVWQQAANLLLGRTLGDMESLSWLILAAPGVCAIIIGGSDLYSLFHNRAKSHN